MGKDKSSDRPRQRIAVRVDGPCVTLRDGETLAGKHIHLQAPAYGRVLFTENQPAVLVKGSGAKIINCMIECQDSHARS